MKNKIRIIVIGLLPVISLIVFSSCLSPIEDYYENNENQEAHPTVLERLQANAEYSTFLKLMEDTGALELLENNQLTIWVPLNSSMPAEVANLDAEQQKALVWNHISASVIYSHNLDLLDGSFVQDLHGRYLDVKSTGSLYYLDNIPLINVDLICEDGVIHEIAEWLIPRPTLYEWLRDLPEEYSIFRDSLLYSRTDTIFDRDNSLIVGVGEDGKYEYDTITKQVNSIFESTGDPRNIRAKFTIFVPNNNAVREMFTSMTNYLDKIKYPGEVREDGQPGVSYKADTIKWMEWLMLVCIHDGLKEYAPGETFLAAANGIKYPLEFRTDYQKLAAGTGKSILSNGWGYTLEEVNIARDIYFLNENGQPQNIITIPSQYRGIHGGTGEPAKHYRTEGTIFGIENVRMDRVAREFYGNVVSNWDDACVTYQFGGNSSDQEYQHAVPYFYEYFTGGANDELGVYATDMMPGRYNMRIRLLNKNIENAPNRTDSLKLYINTKEIGTLTGITASGGGKFLGAQGQYWRAADNTYRILEIPGYYGPSQIMFWVYKYYGSIPSQFRAWRRVSIGRTEFVPADNYTELDSYDYPYDALRDHDEDDAWDDPEKQYPWQGDEWNNLRITDPNDPLSYRQYYQDQTPAYPPVS